MKLSFSLPSKPQSNRSKKPSESFSAANTRPSTANSSSKNYVTKFNPAEAPIGSDLKPKSIPPIPNQWRPNKKSKTYPIFSRLSLTAKILLSNLKWCLMGIPILLIVRWLTDSIFVNRRVLMVVLQTTVVRKLRDDLEKLLEDTGIDEYTDIPVEGFGAALLSDYGWNKDRGIGHNAKEQMCPRSPMAIFCILLLALELVARGSDGFLPSAGSVDFFVVVVSEQ
ncbi:Protein MOS2 [Abeliophyllum distichum]|uniref:Protein MOS2 n=1 Tax=Abeliophyllum distichum TaxID=126358 RepID=A0ABD1RS76_9LAMI